MSKAECYLYLSPHLDDVVLSFGGSIARQTRSGKCVVVATCFAGTPTDYVETEHTRELGERWALVGEPIAGRRLEDREAIARLGAMPLHLDLLDCVYRGNIERDVAYYPLKDDIFGPIHSVEIDLHKAVADLIAAITGERCFCRVYAPIGAGGHVDHIITRSAAVEQYGQTCELLFYEDYPYAGDSDAVGAAIELWQPSPLLQQTQCLSEEDLEAKIAAARCYRSQISTFWASAEHMSGELRTHAFRSGGDHFAEAVWRRIDRIACPHADLQTAR